MIIVLDRLAHEWIPERVPEVRGKILLRHIEDPILKRSLEAHRRTADEIEEHLKGLSEVEYWKVRI